MKFVFLRDDDVFSWDEPGFLTFFGLAKTYGIPVMYAVIPGRLDNATALRLRREKEDSFDLLDLVQHGFLHANRNPDTFPKYEFGPTRDYATQFDDIRRGRDIMDRFFSDSWTPVFVPPYDGFDETTLEVVRDLGFQAFSSDEFILPVKGIINLPYSFALNDYAQDGRPIPIPFREMVRRYRLALGSDRRLLGILFHHSVLSGDDCTRDLELFFRFLKREKEEGRLKLVGVSSILSWLQS